MDFITFSDNNTYLIPNNSNNKYIITFLSEYNIIKSIDNDYITINVNNITPLINIDKIKKQNDDKYINKMIYDIGAQILLLKEYNLSIKYFNLSDIILINDEIFLFINNDSLYQLLESIDIDSSPFTYGKIDIGKIDTNSSYLPQELSSDKKETYYYYTTSYYSFAKLLLDFFNIELKDINDTILYHFCNRCLANNPLDRIFLFI